MGMFSEIAIEETVQQIVTKIEEEFEENKDKPEAQAALKKIGRFVLEQFEWDTPDWAEHFEELFKE